MAQKAIREADGKRMIARLFERIYQWKIHDQ